MPDSDFRYSVGDTVWITAMNGTRRQYRLDHYDENGVAVWLTGEETKSDGA